MVDSLSALIPSVDAKRSSTISIEAVESSTTCQKYEGVVRYAYDAELGKSQLTFVLRIRAGFRELLR